jgi:PKD repeat protein/multisubunit Na+/H+ antiporter MnhF subunit
MTEPQKPSWSLLSEIISASRWKKITISESQETQNPIEESAWWGANDEPPKKNKEPINPITLLKWIWAIFLVAVIFFGSFLAYIVFNPGEAQFFVTTFGIDPREVADLLKKLITLSFGVIFLILSIAWIISLFRAIWTPKVFKRKKILSSITAIFVGIILFLFIAFWSYLFNILKKTDFVNPEGLISIYDSDLLNVSTEKPSPISDSTNLIWPITLTFEIGANAAQVEKTSVIKINTFEIDFDWAICNDDSSISIWSDPVNAKWIVCTFDEARPYKIRWVYHWTDRLWEKGEIPMNIPAVEIRWLVSVKKQKNRNNEDIVTIDASGLKNLWNPRWIYASTNKEIESSSITEKVIDIPQIVGLKLFADEIDRIFIIDKRSNEQWFTGSITENQDIQNPLTYTFNVENLNVDDKAITSIIWTLNDGSKICEGWSTSCEYTFWSYTSYLLNVRIKLANGEEYTLWKTIEIESPLVVLQKAKVKDSEWKVLNTEDTYDTKLHSYVIKDIVPPSKVSFDARDVVTENPEYRLSNVSWEFSDGKKTIKKEWYQVDFELTNPLRYIVKIIYTFSPNIPGTKEEEKTIKEVVIFDIEHKSLIPRFSLQVPSDYVPVVVIIDWSQSYAENSEIKKFTYDFGEWKPPAEGDAIQRYEFKESWEKTITLTITNDRWESASIKKKVVLKENPKIVDFAPSVSPGVVSLPIDFTPSTTGLNISDYIWTFWDNTPSVNEPLPSHIYQTAGKYTVTLTIVYTDGTRKEVRKELEVAEEIQ